MNHDTRLPKLVGESPPTNTNHILNNDIILKEYKTITYENSLSV